MKEKTYSRVIFTGTNGFPFGSAIVQRQLQLANALLNANYKVTVINRRASHNKEIATRENIKIVGDFSGIDYINSSCIYYKSNNFFKRNFFKVLGPIFELFIIIYYRLFKKTKYILNISGSLIQLKYYYYLTRILKMELIYDYVEMVSSINQRQITELNLSKKSFDNQFYNYVDKMIVISSFLDNYIEEMAPSIPRIKIPPIIDFNFFDKVETNKDVSPFFLFCGSADYMDIIMFIIESYNSSTVNNKGVGLKLILRGAIDDINHIHDYISENALQDNIEVLSDLSYTNLIRYYKSANALLIPIRNNLQDQARFPFKICEYTASKSPIITTDTDVIKEYFTDETDAFIALVDDVDSFASKLNLVVNEPYMAVKVGINGYSLGKKVFNYISYSEDLKNLLNNK